MNEFGTLFRVAVMGESHGPGIGVCIDGCPAGIALDTGDFADDLGRRRGGIIPGTTRRNEADIPDIRTGLYRGHTTGGPLLMWFAHDDVVSTSYRDVVSQPRPGHADLVAQERFGGFQDPRGGGHFSGRLTVALVAAGVVAKKACAFPIEARLMSVGGDADIDAAVSRARREGDSVGGIVECRASGIPLGLGEPFFDSVESLISHAAFAIPAVKAVEFGSGMAAGRMRGSDHNDVYLDADGTTATNHAGGISGGLSNGNELVVRVAVKPTSSIPQTQRGIDRSTGEPIDLRVTGRHDACIALRVPPVLEGVVACVLTDLMLRAGRLPRVVPAPARP